MERRKVSKDLLYSQFHFEQLMKLYKCKFDEIESDEAIYKIITESLSDGLLIDRASYWIFENDKLICQNLYNRVDKVHTKEPDLVATTLPAYFKALKDGIAIVADDVLTNEYTFELKENYLIPLGITDMLDVPIRENGELKGVLCCEHRDEPRVWTEADLAFARSVSDILTLMLEHFQRRIVEKELLENQRKMSLITTISNDGFVVFENKVVTYISPSYCKMLGYNEEEVIGTSIQDVFDNIHPDDIENVKKTVYGNMHEKNKNFSYEFRFKAKSGNYFWRQDTVSVVYNDEGTYDKYIIISRDISAVKEAELQIQKLFLISKNLNNRLLDFTHIISHNIRSNTSNITMLIDLMDNTNDETEKQEFFALLKESNEKLVETIYYLSETVNIQLTNSGLKEELIVKYRLDELLKSINAIVLSNNVTISYNFEPSLSIKMIPSYFESIMLNLITNAIKYSSPDRACKIEILIEKINGKVTIVIKDNGLGIDLKRNKDKIFGMYKTFHGNQDAVGLGLFMTRNHIEAMGGTISVQSEVGVGSSFKISLYE